MAVKQIDDKTNELFAFELSPVLEFSGGQGAVCEREGEREGEGRGRGRERG